MKTKISLDSTHFSTNPKRSKSVFNSYYIFIYSDSNKLDGVVGPNLWKNLDKNKLAAKGVELKLNPTANTNENKQITLDHDTEADIEFIDPEEQKAKRYHPWKSFRSQFFLGSHKKHQMRSKS